MDYITVVIDMFYSLMVSFIPCIIPLIALFIAFRLINSVLK